MAHEVLLPQWGMEMEEGTIVRWMKGEGEAVRAGEPLFEVETAKLTSEVEATASGVLVHVLVPEGSTVPCRTLLAIIAAPGEQVARPAPPTISTAPKPVPPAGVARPTPPAAGAIADRSTPAPAAPAAAMSAAPSQPQVVPAARKLAHDHGVDLRMVSGTGPGGRVTEPDVQAAIAARGAPSRGGKTEQLTGVRKTIADRMMESTLTMAPVTLTTTVDMTDAMQLRNARPASGPRPSPVHLVVRAAARGLKEHPRLNAMLRDYEVTLFDEINIGVAVAAPAGLIVPVVRHADRLSLLEIGAKLKDLGERARQGRLTPDDMSGGTFTISSLGAWDVEAFTPIINPPQVAILGVGKVVEQAGVHQGQIAVRSMMVLSLTFNHRAVDGAPAAEYLRAVKRYLQDPAWIFT